MPTITPNVPNYLFAYKLAGNAGVPMSIAALAINIKNKDEAILVLNNIKTATVLTHQIPVLRSICTEEAQKKVIREILGEETFLMLDLTTGKNLQNLVAYLAPNHLIPVHTM